MGGSGSGSGAVGPDFPRTSRLPAPGSRRAAPAHRTPCLCANPREASLEATEASVEAREAFVEAREAFVEAREAFVEAGEASLEATEAFWES